MAGPAGDGKSCRSVQLPALLCSQYACHAAWLYVTISVYINIIIVCIYILAYTLVYIIVNIIVVIFFCGIPHIKSTVLVRCESNIFIVCVHRCIHKDRMFTYVSLCVCIDVYIRIG